MNPYVQQSIQAGLNTSNRFSEGYNRAKDENAIENILSQVSQMQDPRQVQSAIGQILSQVSPERRGDAMQFLQNTYQQMQNRKKESQTAAAYKNAGMEGGQFLSPQLQAQLAKNQQPNNEKNPIGGLAGIPLTPEESQKIENVIRNNPNATAEELQLAFQREGIAPGRTTNFIESRRRNQEAAKPGDEFLKGREKAVTDYVNHNLELRDQAEDMTYTLNEARRVAKGDITGPGVKASLMTNPYTKILLNETPDEAALLAINKKLLEGTKGLFGSKPTEREIFLLMNSMLPAIGRSKEANLASIDMIEKFNNLKIKKADLIDTLTEQGTKYIPNLESTINNLMKQEGKQFISEVKQVINEYGMDKENTQNNQINKPPPGTIRVMSPNGQSGYMTSKQIEAARAKNVIFKPIK